MRGEYDQLNIVTKEDISNGFHFCASSYFRYKRSMYQRTVALGWAGDQKWMNVTKTYAVCLIMCGVAVLAMPLFTFNYILLMSSGAMFGLFFASSFSFTPVILVQLIPLERFTTAYGLILLCQGIGNLIGPPLAGWVFDVTQTWDLSFYMAGLWIIVAGMLIAVIPSTCNRKIWGSGPMEMDIDRDSCA
uniref:Major facilitator superfamily (MFS) profile domain-containing protein n=1 Tax=Timema tahoe TaxID=61484 RepID=A0A7R9IJ08_9NEOP|nr:unnamed protein product [Timema tahoe]